MTPAVPRLDDLALAWHRRAATTGRLHLQRCTRCGTLHHPPRYYCDACSSPGWELVPAAERGSVHSFTITHRSFDPAWADQVPYATVVVELDEGPRVVGALRGLEPASLQLEQRVRIRVEARGVDVAFLWVEPDR